MTIVDAIVGASLIVNAGLGLHAIVVRRAAETIAAAIRANPPLVANAEATERLAARLMEYIEHKWHTV